MSYHPLSLGAGGGGYPFSVPYPFRTFAGSSPLYDARFPMLYPAYYSPGLNYRAPYYQFNRIWGDPVLQRCTRQENINSSFCDTVYGSFIQEFDESIVG